MAGPQKRKLREYFYTNLSEVAYLGLLIFGVNFLSRLRSLYFASYLLQPAYNGETSPNRHVLILAIWNGTVIEYHCVTADCMSVCVCRDIAADG